MRACRVRLLNCLIAHAAGVELALQNEAMSGLVRDHVGALVAGLTGCVRAPAASLKRTGALLFELGRRHSFTGGVA